jgi:hypothetical protein
MSFESRCFVRFRVRIFIALLLSGRRQGVMVVAAWSFGGPYLRRLVFINMQLHSVGHTPTASLPSILACLHARSCSREGLLKTVYIQIQVIIWLYPPSPCPSIRKQTQPISTNLMIRTVNGGSRLSNRTTYALTTTLSTGVVNAPRSLKWKFKRAPQSNC